MYFKKQAGRAAAGLAVLVGLAYFFPPATAAEIYRIDQAHSSVKFRHRRARPRHSGPDASNIVFVHGRFNDFSGSIAADAVNPGASSAQFEVKTQSVDTGNERRDNHLRSPDFFNAKQFPTMSFTSTSVKQLGKGLYEVTGDFTLLGVTKSITARVQRTGGGKDPRRGTSLLGLEITFELKRTDFGMKFLAGTISEDIQVTLDVRGLGQSPPYKSSSAGAH